MKPIIMETIGYYLEDTSKENINSTQRLLSVVGGAYLLSSGIKNIFPPSIDSLLRIAGGSFLLYRGASGYCPLTEVLDVKEKALNIRETLVINKPKEHVYGLWRNLENLPRFMKHLAEVKVLDEKRSLWKAQIPGGVGTIDWEAEILVDKRGEEISWRSIENSAIDNSGKVVFADAKNGTGTILQANIRYSPPAGQVGKAIAKLLNNVFEKMILEDLRRFKDMAESAESQLISLPPKQVYEKSFEARG